MELKTIDFALGKFTANGKEYFIEDRISYRRWIKWRKLQAEVGYGVQFGAMFENMKQAYDLLNRREQKPVEAGIIMHNMMNGIKKVMDDSDIPEVMQMCCLFMNTKDEDRTEITDEIVRQKVEDWSIEGIDMNSFFAFAINLIPSYLESYKKLTQNTSQAVQVEEEGVIN